MPSITFTPNPVTCGKPVKVAGTGFAPTATVHLIGADDDDGERPVGPTGVVYADGRLTGRIVPRTAGTFTIRAIELSAVGVRAAEPVDLVVEEAEKAAKEGGA